MEGVDARAVAETQHRGSRTLRGARPRGRRNVEGASAPGGPCRSVARQEMRLTGSGCGAGDASSRGANRASGTAGSASVGQKWRVDVGSGSKRCESRPVRGATSSSGPGTRTIERGRNPVDGGRPEVLGSRSVLRNRFGFSAAGQARSETSEAGRTLESESRREAVQNTVFSARPVESTVQAGGSGGKRSQGPEPRVRASGSNVRSGAV